MSNFFQPKFLNKPRNKPKSYSTYTTSTEYETETDDCSCVEDRTRYNNNPSSNGYRNGHNHQQRYHSHTNDNFKGFVTKNKNNSNQNNSLNFNPMSHSMNNNKSSTSFSRNSSVSKNYGSISRSNNSSRKPTFRHNSSSVFSNNTSANNTPRDYNTYQSKFNFADKHLNTSSDSGHDSLSNYESTSEVETYQPVFDHVYEEQYNEVSQPVRHQAHYASTSKSTEGQCHNQTNVQDLTISTENLSAPQFLAIAEQVELPASPLPPHLLASSWTMYYRMNKSKSADWKDLETTSVGTINSIESFWQLINHLIQPSKMKKRIGPNLMFFRDDIKPAWEDEKNLGGGMWGIIIKEPRLRHNHLDQLWYESLMACIGETLTFGEYINGVVIQRRQKEDRIQLWTRNADNHDIQYTIGQHYKSLLNLENIEICYTKHADMAKITSTSNRGSVSQNVIQSSLKNNNSNNSPAHSRQSQVQTNYSTAADGIVINEQQQGGRTLSESVPIVSASEDSRHASNTISYSTLLDQIDRLKV